MTARANGKTASRTARRIPGEPFHNGHDPRRGGGKPGRSGRKRLEFVSECSDLTDAQVLAKVKKYLSSLKHGPDDPAWRWCAEYVTNYGKGRPPQEVQHTGKDGEELTMTHTIAFGDTEIAF